MNNSSIYPPSNYKILHSDPTRTDGHDRGVAILTRSDKNHETIILNTNLQAVAVRIFLDRWYTICCIYLPFVPFTENEINDLISQLPRPFLLLGDFNSRSQVWGDTVTNPRGNIIERVILNNEISILNNNDPTHYHIQTGTHSIIDLSFCSSQSMLDFTFNTIKDLHGSDHYPIALTLQRPTYEHTYPERYKVEKANWGDFYQCSEVPTELSPSNDVNVEMETLMAVWQAAASSSIPYSNERSLRIPVPWWNEACQRALRDRKRAQRALHRNHTLENSIAYKRKRAICKRVFKEAKRESWEKFVTSINSTTPTSMIWKKIRKTSKKFSTPKLPLLERPDLSVTNDPTETANIFGTVFSNISNSSNYSQTFRNYKQIQENEIINFSTQEEIDYNDAFSVKEYSCALARCPETSPGADQITYSMIKHLHPSSTGRLLRLFNLIFSTGVFPEGWRTSVIIPIPKQGQDHKNPQNYRPIALTSCVCKLFEKMINNRLKYYLEKQTLISDYQSGFRSNRSTTDTLAQFASHLHNAIDRGEHTIAVFFDLKKAYDTTWKFGILKKLKEVGLKGNLPIIIGAFLEGRKLRVKVGNILSEVYMVEEGLPQGSVLSCTLFTLSIDSIIRRVCAGVQAGLYVDDFTIWASSRLPGNAERKIQVTLNNLVEWCNTTGYTFSQNKTICLHICRKRGCVKTADLSLNNQPIDIKTHHKLLGLVIDNSLTWTPHVEQLKNSCLRKLDILKYLSHRTWGSDMTLLLQLYKSIIKSKIEYGIEIYGSACKSLMNRIEPIQNQAARIASGALKSSPIESLLCVTGLRKCLYSVDLKTAHFIIRAGSDQRNPLCEDLRSLTNPGDSEMTEFQSRSFRERSKKLISEYEINLESIMDREELDVSPWKVMNTRVCYCMFEYTKNQYSNTQMLNLFLSHLEDHRESLLLYTDGSRAEGRCAYGVKSESYEASRRINDKGSSFSAELLGILDGIEYANNTDATEITIVTDSRSSIQAISNNQFPNNDIIKRIFHSLSVTSKVFNLCWAPAHVGVPGNSRADVLANEGRNKAHIYFYPVTKDDMKNYVKHKISRKWDEVWHNVPITNKLRKINSSPNLFRISKSRNRLWERCLTRLRIGHTRFSHAHLMAGEPPPECEVCLETLTVEHVLVECPAYATSRMRYYPIVNQRNLKYMLIDGDTLYGGTLYRFLTEIRMLDMI